MQQNATDQDLLEALTAGATVTAAAAAARVDRVTVHRWLRDDFAFQAAFNRARRDLRSAAEARLLGLLRRRRVPCRTRSRPVTFARQGLF